MHAGIELVDVIRDESNLDCGLDVVRKPLEQSEMSIRLEMLELFICCGMMNAFDCVLIENVDCCCCCC